MSRFSPTPVPEPANPLPSPQPQSDPTIPSPPPSVAEQLSETAAEYRAFSRSGVDREAFLDHNFLRLIEHAFWLLASHCIDPRGPFPLVCAACSQAWPCPSIIWAADWILAARRHGLLEEFGIQITEDIAGIIERWHRDGLAATARQVA